MEATEEKIVYLEDVQPVKAAKKDADSSTDASKKDDSTAGASTTGVKRQRTLDDMFGSQGSSSGSATKKLKPAGSFSTSSASGTKPTRNAVVKSFGLQKLNSIPFSMAEFQDSLSLEQRNLLRLECEVMGKSWLKLLKDEIKKPYFIALKQFLWNEGVRGADDTPKSLPIYPSPRNIYAWSNTPLGRIKVVMIGQDPYHGAGQAHGLCFSVPIGVAVPPSLMNIYKEIKAEYPEFETPKHGNLTAWASSGVLMLNTCLTVRAGDAGSHSNRGWEQFTDKVVDVVDKYGGANLPSASADSKSVSDASGIGRGVVFLAWGAWAAKRVAKLDKGKHLILMSAHPSPLSCHRGFLGNGHFKKANEWLEQKYGPEGRVDWCNL